SPYLAWLGRYQAFYLLGLALLVLFGFVWGLLARTPAPVVQHVIAPPPVEPEDGVVSPPRRAPRTPTLIGADIGEPRSEPARSRDVPWSAGDGPSGEHKMVEPPRPPPAAAETKAAPEPPAEALHEPSAEPGTWPPPQSEAGPSAEAAREPAAEPAEWERPAQDEVAAHDWQLPAGQVTNGLPADASETPSPVREILDPLAAPEPRAEPFPGDEPTLVEGVSAALIDKLRERDEEPAAEAAPEANVTMQDFSMPGAEEADPDELHWRETYDRFRELKVQLGEPADRLSFEKFAAKLKKNRTDLLAKHNCKGVRFSVYEKDGRAAIKASAIR